MSKTSNNISIKIDNSMSYDIHTLEYYAVDMGGNRSVIHATTFTVRSIPVGQVAAWQGVNFTDRILGARQTGRQPYPNQPPSVRDNLLDIIKPPLSRINMIRARMYWEAYRYFKQKGLEDIYINRIKEFATEADKLGIGIVYDVGHQYHISSYFYDGVGFPWEVTSYLVNVRQRWNTDLAVRFWDDFLNNAITDTYTNKKIWQSFWDDYFSLIVSLTKDHESTLGWCILNEPVFSGRDTLPEDVYDKLGAFHTFIAQKIVDATSNSKKKSIIFQRIYDGRTQWEFDKKYHLLKNTVPNISEKDRLVFEAHFYRPGAIPSGTKQRWTEIINNLGLPIFIGEWNTDRDTELTLDYAIDYYKTFKQWGGGSAYFTYDPGYPWSIKDENYNDRILSSGASVRDILAAAIKQVFL